MYIVVTFGETAEAIAGFFATIEDAKEYASSIMMQFDGIAIYRKIAETERKLAFYGNYDTEE